MKPNTRVVFTEAPGSNTFEMQDIPAIAKAAHARGAIVMMDNTWATPLYFKAARPRRRHLDPRGDQISGRPFRRAARHRLGQRSLLGAAARDLHHAGLLRWPGRRLPGAARPAHDGRAARAAPGERAGDRALARRAGRRRRACCTRRWRASRPRDLEARLQGLERPVLDRARGRRQERRRMPSSTRSASSGSAIPGAATRALPCRCGSATEPSPATDMTAR